MYGIIIIQNACVVCLTATGVCQPSCVNGVCNETIGQCDCSPGYTGVACDDFFPNSLAHSTPT